MALFTTEKQMSAYARDPSYYSGSKFMLGLMGYKANGQQNTFGKVRDVALPVIGGIAGAVLGGPAGAAVGSSLGQGLNAVANRNAAAKFAGFQDSVDNVDAALPGSLARGSLGQGLGNLAGGISGAGIKSGDSLKSVFDKISPALQQSLPDIAQGLATTTAADALTPVTRPKGVRFFRTGGEASPAFAERFRAERAAQGPGGRFTFQGKQYNTFFREEVDDAGRPMAGVLASLPGFQPGEVPSMNNSSVSGIKKKSGVHLDGVNSVLTSYLNQLPDDLRSQVLVTSGTDSFGVHSPKSRHRTGNALDLRFKPALYAHIQSDPVAARLGLSVLDPNHGTAPHIHLQYTGDPAGEGSDNGAQFRTGGEAAVRKTQPYTYTYAGMTFTVQPPSDYKVHEPGSLAEDLVMFDKQTGTYYGQMRLGERIFDQESNLGMKAIMHSSASDSQKREALGELVHDELLTHVTQDGNHEFARGGESTARRTVPSTPPIYAGRSLDEAFSQAKAARSPVFVYAGKTYRAIDLDPLAGSWATPKPQTTTGSMSELDRYRQSAYYKQRTGTAPTTAAPTAPRAPLTATPAASRRTTASSSASITRTSRTSRPPVTTTAAPATTAPAVKPTATSAVVQSFARSYKPAEIEVVGKLPVAPGGTGMSTKPVITDTTRAAVGVAPVQQQTDWKPSVTQPAPQADTSTLAGNLLDVGRVALGAAIGAKKTPVYEPPASFTQLQGELAGKKNEGYTGQQWSTINGQIADNYQAGVTALTNSMGGGATPGSILAGLSRLSQVRGQQTQAAVAGDAAVKRANFGQYVGGVGQQLNLSRQLYQDDAARVAGAQAAGAALAQSGLQNMAQRQVYNENYGPGSTYQRLAESQIDREREAADLLRKMRTTAASRPLLAA